MSIGKNIAKYRKIKNLTQEELGTKLGVTNQAVSKWESEASLPDVMLLPKIANALDITLNDLYSIGTEQAPKEVSHVINMDAVHNFPKEAQAMITDALYNKTNLLNGGIWDFMKVPPNPQTKKYDRIKANNTLLCISDTVGASFISDDLTMIDSGISMKEIASIFDKTEIASGIKKLADHNVRKALFVICDEYFHSPEVFNDNSPEYFFKDIDPVTLSKAIGITMDETFEVLEKLTSLHLIDIETKADGRHYMFEKFKAIEVAVTFRLIERLIYNQGGFGCGEIGSLIQC